MLYQPVYVPVLGIVSFNVSFMPALFVRLSSLKCDNRSVVFVYFFYWLDFSIRFKINTKQKLWTPFIQHKSVSFYLGYLNFEFSCNHNAWQNRSQVVFRIHVNEKEP